MYKVYIIFIHIIYIYISYLIYIIFNIYVYNLQVNLYIWLTISSCYGSISLNLGLIGNDDGLSTVCHRCGFACQQRVLKTFPGSWLFLLQGWGSLTMTFTGKFAYIYYILYTYIYILHIYICVCVCVCVPVVF